MGTCVKSFPLILPSEKGKILDDDDCGRPRFPITGPWVGVWPEESLPARLDILVSAFHVDIAFSSDVLWPILTNGTRGSPSFGP